MTTRLASALGIHLLLALTAAGGAACSGQAATPPQTPPPPPVVVGQVVRKTVPRSVHSIGSVEAVASVTLRSQVAGQILKVHIADGAIVTKGQLLFTIDPAPFEIALAQAEAQLARDKAMYEKAENDAARYGKLVEKEYVTREQYESSVANVASLKGTIQADEAAVNEARLSLSYCRIASPIAGRAGAINLKAGNLVKANDDPPLVMILTVQPINVIFSVPEKYLSAVRTRAAAGPLAVKALPRGGEGAPRSGTLAFIDNTVDPTTGAIRLKAVFENADLGLWPGQFVETELILAEQKDAVLVPTAALQVGQQGSFVYVVAADGTAQIRPVVVDRAIGDDSVIASGLDGGETVITDGQLRVVPGGKVAPSAKS